MSAGALAGVGFWLTAFPQDTIKSVIQTQQHKESFWRCGHRLVREEGARRLFRGFSVAVLRGIPGASVTFLVFTRVRKWTDQRDSNGGCETIKGWR